FAESLLEGNWNPSKHPRLGGPPNAGWWATTQGGAQGAAPTGGHMIAATSAIHTTSKGTPAQFSAAHSGGGHHWVPRVAFGGFESRMDKDAWDVFASGTKSPELYDHAF